MGGRGGASGRNGKGMERSILQSSATDFGLDKKTVSAKNSSPASEKQISLAKNAISKGKEKLRSQIETRNKIDKALKEYRNSKTGDYKTDSALRDSLRKKYNLSSTWHTDRDGINWNIQKTVKSLRQIKNSKDLSSVYDVMKSLT